MAAIDKLICAGRKKGFMPWDCIHVHASGQRVPLRAWIGRSNFHGLALTRLVARAVPMRWIISVMACLSAWSECVQTLAVSAALKGAGKFVRTLIESCQRTSPDFPVSFKLSTFTETRISVFAPAVLAEPSSEPIRPKPAVAASVDSAHEFTRPIDEYSARTPDRTQSALE